MNTMNYVRATEDSKPARTLMGLRTRTGVKGGSVPDAPDRSSRNHNQTLLGYKMRTGVKAGSVPEPPERHRNHNETLLGYKLRTGVKAGVVPDAPDRSSRNHNQTFLEDVCVPLCDARIDSLRS